MKAADTVGTDTCGYDARKKVTGPERFIVTDTAGPLTTVAVLAASWQDRDGAKTALLSTYLATPIRHVFADQGLAGRLVDWTRDTQRWSASPLISSALPCTPPVGGRADTSPAHRLPPVGPRLRTPF